MERRTDGRGMENDDRPRETRRAIGRVMRRPRPREVGIVREK